MGFCSSFAKYILIGFNFLFWIVGAILLGVGIWALVDKDAAELLKVIEYESALRASAITLITVGSLVFFVAFFGCFGACRESACMLMTYAIIVGVLLGIQVIAGILGAVFKDRILAEAHTQLNATVYEEYGQQGYETATDGWNHIQRYFGCCGALEGPSEWKESLWYKDQEDESHVVPVTCCVLTNKDKYDELPAPVNETLCYLSVSNSSAVTDVSQYVHTEACESSFKDYVVDHAKILMGVAFGLATVQLLGVIFACCFAKNIKSEYQYV